MRDTFNGGFGIGLQFVTLDGKHHVALPGHVAHESDKCRFIRQEDILLSAICDLHASGLEVWGVCTDNSQLNAVVQRVMRQAAELSAPSVPTRLRGGFVHPVVEGMFGFNFSDIDHLGKALRNNLFACRLSGDRQLWVSQCVLPIPFLRLG